MVDREEMWRFRQTTRNAASTTSGLVAARSRLYRSSAGESGASLVEFALILPLLLSLLFGVIEMAWAFSQVSDVRHGAREGARVAAVDVGTVAAIGQTTCDRMDVISPAQNVSVNLTPVASSPTNPGEGSLGALAQISVSADLKTLTGFFDFILAGKTLTSTVEFRLEQPSGGSGDSVWWAEATSGTDTYTCP